MRSIGIVNKKEKFKRGTTAWLHCLKIRSGREKMDRLYGKKKMRIACLYTVEEKNQNLKRKSILS